MKQIYVFGAGASAASAGTPLGRDLVWNCHLDCADLLPIIKGIPDHRGENKDFKNLRKLFEQCPSIYPEFKSLLEKWDSRDFGIFDISSRIEKKHYIDEYLKELLLKRDERGIKLVRKLIFEHLVGSSEGSPNLLYKKFIEKILKKSLPHQVSVISFNFDFLLKEDFEKGVYFDYLLKFDWIDPHRQKIYAQNNPIKLIKLNGSLDWGICQSCNRLYLYFPHMSRNSYDDKKCFEGCGKPVQPFIIIPHDEIAHSNHGKIIEPLWVSAEEELKQASKVTIIGYSFPDYDQRVVDLFSSSLGPHCKLEVVDHCESNVDKEKRKNFIIMKYKKIFPLLKTEIDINLNGFEGYIDNYETGGK